MSEISTIQKERILVESDNVYQTENGYEEEYIIHTKNLLVKARKLFIEEKLTLWIAIHKSSKGRRLFIQEMANALNMSINGLYEFSDSKVENIEIIDLFDKAIEEAPSLDIAEEIVKRQSLEKENTKLIDRLEDILIGLDHESDKRNMVDPGELARKIRWVLRKKL